MAVEFQRRYVTAGGERTTYRVYAPAGVQAPLPLILFLHGAGESGTNDLAPTTVGIGPAIAREPSRFPAVVVFPQASRGYGWSAFNMSAAIAALDDAQSQYDVDARRVYVTGISMGGYGTWALAAMQPERFAAIVPVCGGLDARTLVQAGAVAPGTREQILRAAVARIARTPQWVFHGDADNIIPVSESRTMVAALRDAGADVRYTEYRGVKHNSWDRAYAEAELMPWLLGHQYTIA